MSLHAAVTCPNCGGSDCRKSKWQSDGAQAQSSKVESGDAEPDPGKESKR